MRSLGRESHCYRGRRGRYHVFGTLKREGIVYWCNAAKVPADKMVASWGRLPEEES